MIKNIFDFMAAAVGLTVLSPVLIWIAWKIKAEDHGTVFFRGMRVGLHGNPFRIYKFRTMLENAEKLGGTCTADDDVRITHIGRFLRKHKLDELPQLINVIVGDMSLVGPRPEVRKFTNLYTDEENAILSIRPGITDWASLWNSDEGALLKGSIDPEKYYLEKIRPMKIQLQLKYVRERTFWTDIVLILITLKSIIYKQKD